MSSAVESGGSVEYYFYAPDGKRVFRQMANGTVQFTFWGAYGEQLGTYTGPGNPALISVYFGKRLLWQGGLAYNNSAPATASFVMPDRLGSNLNAGAGTFYPYGDPSGVGQDKVEFATYTRDSYTGFDNAVNRYYSSNGGRFNTPDPYMAKAEGANDPSAPGSWNRYGYVLGDPVNHTDSRGTFLDFCDPDLPACDVGCDPVDGLPECIYYPTPILGGVGGGGSNNFTDADAKAGASNALSIPACLGLIFGGTKWDNVKAAQNQLSIRDVLSSSKLPAGEPQLGAAVILGTQGGWSSNEPWGENNGSNIYVNALYFPNDTNANIKTPWGTTLSAVAVFNHDHNTNFSGLQVEEAVILHELWEAAGNASSTNNPDSAANMTKLLSLCFP
jgi:RHS repeat-associated protein